MKHLVILALVLTLGACASAPELKQRPIQGTVADRLLAIQESMFALIARSSTSTEAAERITAYCQSESEAIEQLTADAGALGEEGPEAEALRNEVARRSEKLIDRASEALEDRVHLMTDGQVIVAMARCRTRPESPSIHPESP